MKKLIPILAAVMLLAGCGKAAESTELTTDKEVTLDELVEDTILGDYSKIPIDIEDPGVTEEEIQAELDNYLSYATSYEHITEGVVEEGNTVNISFVGRMDGEEFDGGSGEYDLTIGSGQFIPGFEDGLIGTEIGGTAVLDLTFPEDYEESLAGKAVEFTVKVNYKNGDEIEPVLSDEYVSSTFGFESVKEMKDYITEYLETQHQTAYEQQVNDLVYRYIEGESKIPAIPMPYIDEYVNDAKVYYLDYAKQNGITGDDYIEQLTGMTEEEFVDEAEAAGIDYYRRELVMLAAAKDMGIQVTDEDFEAYLEDQANAYGYTDKEELRKELEENDVMELFKKEILYNKTLEALKDNIV